MAMYSKYSVYILLKTLRIIPDTINRKKANCIGHSMRRNYLLKHITKGNTDGKRRRGKRGKQLVKYLKEKNGY
jgi:hypothetical protein